MSLDFRHIKHIDSKILKDLSNEFQNVNWRTPSLSELTPYQI